MNLKKLNIFIVYFAIIANTNVLGIYRNTAGIGLGQLNVLGQFQLIYLILLFIGLLLNFQKFSLHSSPVKKFIILYFAIVIFSIFKGLFHVSAGEISLSEYLFNVKTINLYVFFIFLLSAFKSTNDIFIFFKIINQLAIVSAFIIVYQILFVPDTIYQGQTLYDQFRFMSTTSGIVTFSFFINLSKLLHGQKFILQNILFTLLTFFCVAVQMHRSVLIALGFTIILALFLQTTLIKILKNYILAVILISIVSFFLLKVTSFSINYIDLVVSSSINDISDGQGSFFIRYNTLVNTFIDVFNNYPLFGRGFVWEEVDFLSYLTTFHAKGPTNDNTFSSVLICFGFIGLYAYLGFIITAINHLYKKVKKEYDNYTFAIFLILVYSIIIQFFSNSLIGNSGSIVLQIMFFLVLLSLSKNVIVNQNDSKKLTTDIRGYADV